MIAQTKYSNESSAYTIRHVFSSVSPAVAFQAVAISSCESGLNNKALNPKDLNNHASIGLMQISMLHGYDREYLFNPYNNAKVALDLYKKAGWRPWYNCAKQLKLLPTG